MSWSYTAEVSSALLKRRVHFDLTSISFQDRSIPLVAIEAVRLRVTKTSVNGIPTNTRYEAEFAGSQVPTLRMVWGYGSIQSKATKAQCEEAYATLLNLLNGEVGGRVISNQLGQPLPTKFGPYEITPSEITVRGIFKTTQVPWPAVTGTEMTAGVQTVTYTKQNGSKGRLGGMDLWQDNALWLPQIIGAYQQRFTAPHHG